MSQQTDDLIQLLSKAGAAVPLSPFRLLAHWLLPSFFIVGALFFGFSVREDFSTVFTSQGFIVELVLAAAIFATGSLMAVWMSYPDSHGQFGKRFVPIFLLILMGAYLSAAWVQNPDASYDPSHHLHAFAGEASCTLCLFLFAAAPFISMALTLRKAASVHPFWVGTHSALAVWAIGYIALRITEPVDYIPHLMIYHFLPILLLIGIGAILAKKFLGWK